MADKTPSLDRVFNSEAVSYKSAHARAIHNTCHQNAMWVRFDSNDEITWLFLRRIATRFSPISNGYIHSYEPLAKGEFYVDEQLVKAYFWHNGALFYYPDKSYELFIHLKDVQKWKLNDNV